jgi:long-chain acyl-CoA synthetase
MERPTDMQEYSTPPGVDVDPDETLPDLLWKAEAAYPGAALLTHRVGDRFAEITTVEFADAVRRVAAGLIALGVEPGDRVALFSPTRHEFTIFDFAIWVAGAATVTIYETSSAEQVEWILGDSASKVLVAASRDLVDVYEAQAAAHGGVEHVLVIDEGAVDHLAELGAHLSDDDVRARADGVGPGDLATLVYTSGTTGMPKGCTLTHHNFVWTQHQAQSAAPEIIHEGAVTLMFLPLAHIFARLLQVMSVAAGGTIAYSTGIPNLMEELRLVRPTWIFAVPRVFEKVYNGAVAKAADEGKGKVFGAAAGTAIAYAEAREAGRVPLGLAARHRLFDKLVYSKLRDALGGRCEHALSGGAPLGTRLGFFFDGIGLTVFEGYGLTETTAGSTVGTPRAHKVGTVGRPIAGVTVHIADDGEILIKGENVFQGYWNNPVATAEMIDPDGWLHSGDIGEIDDDGFVRITGRKKELIVTAAGKNVAPAVLEDRLRAHPLVSQCMAVGDNRPFVAAVITIDPEEWERFAERRGKGALVDHLVDPDLLAEVQSAVTEANKVVSRAESIRSFRILPEDFSIETGELTPTLKVKRRVVAEKYADEIERIYA